MSVVADLIVNLLQAGSSALSSVITPEDVVSALSSEDASSALSSK